MKLKILSLAALMSTTYLSIPVKAENLDHTRQLLSTKQCQKCDLSGSGLVMANLAGAKLSGTNFSGANLSRANLSGADLSGADLTGTSLYGANLTGANLTGANLTGTDLREAYLSNANFTGVNLNTAYLQGAISIPSTAAKPEDFYRLAIAEAQLQEYKKAIDYYNQALSIKPDFAYAYLGRGVARYRLGDENGAIIDAQASSEFFSSQKNKQGVEMSQNFIKAVKEPQKARGDGGSNILNVLGSVSTLLLRLLF